MENFRGALSISRKIATATMLISVVVLVLTTTAFILFDTYSYRRNAVERVSAMAAIIAGEGKAALAARDKTAAQSVLNALKAEPRLKAAAFYDAQGRFLAGYPPEEPPSRFPAQPPAGLPRFEQDRLQVSGPVSEEGAPLGTIYLEAEMRPVRERLREYAGIAFLVFSGSVLLALALSQAVQRRISRPILELANTAQQVTGKHDFSLRAARLSDDEIGTLTDAFNDMLSRIQKTEQQLRESQNRFSSIILSAMDAIISVDQNQKIKVFNAAAETMFRCPAAEAIGQPLDRFIPQRFRHAHREQVEEFGRTGRTNRAMGELRPLSALRADGEEFPIEATISQSEVGGERLYTVILRDISERLATQEQIRLLNTDLERRVAARTAELTAANRELESFTYSVAHDLRAPLRHIDAFSRIVNEDYAAQVAPEGRRLLERISEGSRHMSHLVDDLLNLARLGRQPLLRKPVALRPLVEESIQDLAREAEGRRVQWKIQDLPTLECDAGLIKQVFTNLISNALKYTRPRPEAVIEVGRLDGSDTLFVRDNGVGFDMRYRDKLFGVFQRLHPAEEFEGTGIGLATVARIVRRHGGRVWAEGTIDQGAAFYFTVPQEAPDHAAEASPAPDQA